MTICLKLFNQIRSLVLLCFLFISSSLLASEQRFLSSYDGFIPHPELESAQYWLKSGLEFKDIALYEKFLFLPIEVWYARDERHNGISPDKIKVVTDYFRVSLESSLAPTYQLVELPGDGVMVVRTAIAGVRQYEQEATPDGSVNVEALLAGMSESPEESAGRTVHVITAVLEVEMFDARTGERLFAFIDQQTQEQAEVTGEERSFETIKSVLDNWSERFRRGLDRYREQ